MSIFNKDYKQPRCPDCDSELLYQEAYLKAKTFKIDADGVPGTINLTPNIPEVLEFKHLVCGRCDQSFEIKLDAKNRIYRGSKS